MFFTMREIGVSEDIGGQNPLALEIENKIRDNGPIPFSEYMRICHDGLASIPGFYSSGEEVIGDSDGRISGKRVDFTTSPERSPLFGFMIARQILEMRVLMGEPDDFTVVEMGAGNGTLARDILGGLEYFDPEAASFIRYKIVENSCALIERQKDTLKGFQAEFIEQSATEPLDEPITGIILSNELLDDLPTHIVRRTQSGYEELYIESGNVNEFSEIWLPPSEVVTDYLRRYEISVGEGELFPISTEAERWMKSAGASLKQGYILTFDYDYFTPNRPFRVFAAPSKGITKDEAVAYRIKSEVGKVNVTSEVYFQALAETGKLDGLQVVGDVTQGGFLQGLAFHFFRDRFGLEYSKLPQRIRGDRLFHMPRADELLSSLRVLIQSKGVETGIALMGAKWVYHDNTGKEEKTFRPLLV